MYKFIYLVYIMVFIAIIFHYVRSREALDWITCTLCDLGLGNRVI